MTGSARYAIASVLFLFGVTFAVLLAATATLWFIRTVRDWSYWKRKEAEYADQWVAAHRRNRAADRAGHYDMGGRRIDHTDDRRPE